MEDGHPFWNLLHFFGLFVISHRTLLWNTTCTEYTASEGKENKHNFGKQLSINFRHQHKQAHTTCLSHLHARISWESSSGRMYGSVENICWSDPCLALWTLTSYSPYNPYTWTTRRHSSSATTTRDTVETISSCVSVCRVVCFAQHLSHPRLSAASAKYHGAFFYAEFPENLGSSIMFNPTRAALGKYTRKGSSYSHTQVLQVTHGFTVRGQNVGWCTVCISHLSLCRSS